MRLLYFQAKSRIRHRTASEGISSQKTGLVKRRGTKPSYSVEMCTFGATVA